MTLAHRFLASAILLLLAASLCAMDAQGQATRTVRRTIDLDSDGSVSVSTFSGAVDVTTWDRTSVEVEVRIEGASQESVDRTEVRFDGRGSRLDIEADFDVQNLRTDDGYRGAVNGGGPRLEFDTFSGDFRLRAK